jgi:hypothetical protein
MKRVYFGTANDNCGNNTFKFGSIASCKGGNMFRGVPKGVKFDYREATQEEASKCAVCSNSKGGKVVIPYLKTLTDEKCGVYGRTHRMQFVVG